MSLKKIKNLIKIANKADLDGDFKKADLIDKQILKLSGEKRKTLLQRVRDYGKQKQKKRMTPPRMQAKEQETMSPKEKHQSWKQKAIKDIGKSNLYSDYSQQLERAFVRGEESPYIEPNLEAEMELSRRKNMRKKREKAEFDRMVERMYGKPSERDYEVPDISMPEEEIPTAEVYYEPEEGDGLDFLLEDSEESEERSIFDVPKLPKF